MILRDAILAKKQSETRLERRREVIEGELITVNGEVRVQAGNDTVVWVRGWDQSGAVFQALNHAVRPIEHTPVLVARDPTVDFGHEILMVNRAVLAHLDDTGILPYLEMINHAPTHEWPDWPGTVGLDPVNFYPRAFGPGRVHRGPDDQALEVSLAPFWYRHGGVMAYYAGLRRFDLSSFQPAVSEAVLVLVAFDPVTGRPMATAGAAAVVSELVLPPFPALPADRIGLGLVRLDGSQTVFVEQDFVIDPRLMLQAAQASGDMLKSVYDADLDGVVDAAETAPWAGITGVPATFPPSTHDHNTLYYTEAETDTLLAVHPADASDAHDASAISAVTTAFAGNLSALDDTVQKALDTLDDLSTGGAPSATVAGETTYDITPAAGASTDYSRGDHTHGSPPNIGLTIDAATGKTTPVDADELGLADSAASFALKKLTWANLKATAKTYFDTLYSAITHNLLSATHADTLADTVIAGDIIIGNATPKWARLPRGTDGEVLTLVAGLPDWAAAGAASTAWPAPGKLKIGTTEYATLALAVAAAVSGDTIFAGIGTHTADAVVIPAGVGVWALDPYNTIFTSSTQLSTIILSNTGSTLGNITVTNTFSSASTTQAVLISGSATKLLRVLTSTTNAGGEGNGCNMTGGDARLYDCEMSQTGSPGDGLKVATAQAVIYGGDYDSIRGGAAGIISLYNYPAVGAAGITSTVPATGMAFINSNLYVLGGSELALPLGTTVNEFSIDGTLAGNSDNAVPTEKAVKTYVDAGALIKNAPVNLLYHSLTHDIWSEGASFPDIADDTYVADLWTVLHNGQAPDITGEAGGASDPFKRAFRCTFDSASSQAGLVQFLNNEDTIPLRGKTVSLSAELWGTNVTTLRMAVLEWSSTADTLTSDVVGTWGAGNPTLATNWAYIGTPAAITISGTRARFSVSNLAVGASTNNLAVFIWSDALEASGDLFNIANVQLEEIGAVATAFVGRTFSEEVSAVQWFLNRHDYITASNEWITGGFAISTTQTRIDFSHPMMQRVPTVTFSAAATFINHYGAGVNTVCSAISASNGGRTSFLIISTVGSAVFTLGFGVALARDGTDATWIQLDARL